MMTDLRIEVEMSMTSKFSASPSRGSSSPEVYRPPRV
jgi:hypothetical protein